MELNQEWLGKARAAFRASGDDNLAEAIETYIAEMFKPGELIVGGADQPPRDYRKELWIGVAERVAGSDATTNMAAPAKWANETLAAFDKTFPPEPAHG